MNFELTERQLDLREVARAVGGTRISPGATEREAAHATSPEDIRALGEQGLLGVNIPRALGGIEAGAVAYAVALREIAQADAAVAVTMAVSNMVAEVITHFGTAVEKERHVPKIASGEYFGGAFALSEPGAGSDAAALRAKADRSENGWVLSGEKLWITTGDDAGVIVVWARSNDRPGAKGISAFLVDGDAAGLSAGRPEHKMGLRASHTVALTLDGVEVPESALLGEEGGGFRIAMMALDGGRIGIGSQSCGLGSAAIDATCRWAHQTGRASDSGLHIELADMRTELEAAWLLTLRAAWLKQEGVRFTREAAMAKVLSSEAANRIVRRAVQVRGNEGTLEEAGVARLLRDCRVTQIYKGTSEVQRMVIARDVLREVAG